MEVNFNPNDRGQVGIGTLIVFIAMVLVAAIAAGVLINTAGFLQTQAEDTGTESTEQVANNLNVITTVGDVSSSGDTIDDIRIGVQPAAGSDDLNLEELSIQYVSDESFSNLIHVQQADVDSNDNIVGEGTVFNTEAVTAEDGTDNVMTDNADRYEVVVPLGQGITNVGSASVDDEGLFYTVQAATTTDSGGGDDDISSISASDGEVAVVDSSDVAQAIIDLDDVDPRDLATFQERDGIEDSNDGTSVDNVPSVKASYINDLDNGNLNEMAEGEVAELTFTTETGAQTVTILQVPDSLAGQDQDDTVDL